MIKKYFFISAVFFTSLLCTPRIYCQGVLEIINEVNKVKNICNSKEAYDIDCIIKNVNLPTNSHPQIYSYLASVLYLKGEKTTSTYYAKMAAKMAIEAGNLNNNIINDIYFIMRDANEHQYFLNSVITKYVIEKNSDYLKLSYIYAYFDDYKKREYYYNLYDPYKEIEYNLNYFLTYDLIPVKGQESKECALVDHLYNYCLKALVETEAEKKYYIDQLSLEDYNLILLQKKKNLRRMIVHRSFCFGKQNDFFKARDELNRANELLPFTLKDLEDREIVNYSFILILKPFWKLNPNYSDYHRRNTVPDFLKSEFDFMNQSFLENAKNNK